MAFSPLITFQRAQLNQQLAAMAASNPAYLATLVDAASWYIRRACCRDFSQQGYIDYYDLGVPQGTPIRLRQFPIIEVTRVATDPEPVLQVQNTDNVTNQRATVETTSTGIVLRIVASAVMTPTTLLYTAYPTIQAVANAINALGHGWSATIEPGANVNYALYPSADLCQSQGAMTALMGAVSLQAWIESLPPMSGQQYSGGWGIGLGDFGFGGGWNYDAECGLLYIAAPAGSQSCRVDYTAGYTTVPQPIQEAVTQTAVWLYQTGQANYAIESQRLGPFGQTIAQLKDLPPAIKLLIRPYIAHDQIIDRQ